MKMFIKKRSKHKDPFCGNHRKNITNFKFFLPLCLLLIFGVFFTVGGTLAFMKEQTNTVTNTFKAGEITYTLNLEANAANANAKYHDSDVTMPESLAAQMETELSVTFSPNKEPSLSGYTFSGWYYDKDCIEQYTSVSGKNIIVSYHGIHDNNEDANKVEITLYAKWTPITYTVIYEANEEATGETIVTGSTASSIHTYDAVQNLTRNGYERIGYTFIGWNTEPNGSGASYSDNESVINLTTRNNSIVRLYAQWSAKSYIIRYHANGGEGTMADQAIKYDVPTALRKNAFTKSDYSFGGWALNGSAEAEYIDEQIVVNLLESGTLDLYAVWIQNSHTVTFDYNGGTGSPDSKQVQAGKAYGTLPEYPVHPTKEISSTEVMSYLFEGWYTAPVGGTRVYPSDIVNRTDDHTLYAHWKEAPTNNIIKNLTVKNNPDDNGDGVVDAFYVNLTCSSYFEKYNIPLENLVVGQKYRLSFTESNNATYGMNETGYGGAIYGFIITSNKTLSQGSIKNESIADGGLIKQFSDRNDGDLNGPRDWSTTFTAEAGTMYWTWDYGLILDGYARDYNYTNIQLVPVEPEIKFSNKKLILHESSNAQVLNDTSGAYSTSFVFDGAGYAETMYYPITGLTAGTTYSITFDHSFAGTLIDSSKYDYGCGITSTAPTKYGSYMSSISDDWISDTFVMSSVTGNTESVTLTFTATSGTAYWVWNMANCSDSNNCTINVKVTEFSASHKNGGSITYYDAASQATTLGLMIDPTNVPTIAFDWSGINDANMEAWYPIDEQYPAAGDSYELAFEPAEGYAMAEIITVVIDDAIYDVRTDVQIVEGTIAPAYEPESNVLTIPAELLTADTTMVAVSASAVPLDSSIATEPEEAPVDAEPVSEDETEPAEEAQKHEIAITLNLTNMTAQDYTTLQAGTDYRIVLVPDKDYELPEVLRVEIDDVLYEVYTDGLEHRTLADDKTELPPMPAFDPETGTLMIPAVLLSKTTESVTITISAVEIIAMYTETEDFGETQDSQAGAEESAEEGSENTSEPTPDCTVSSDSSTALPPDNKEEEPGEDTEGDHQPDDTTAGDGADNESTVIPETEPTAPSGEEAEE